MTIASVTFFTASDAACARRRSTAPQCAKRTTGPRFVKTHGNKKKKSFFFFSPFFGFRLLGPQGRLRQGQGSSFQQSQARCGGGSAPDWRDRGWSVSGPPDGAGAAHMEQSGLLDGKREEPASGIVENI